MSDYTDIVIDQLVRHEGFRPKPYTDTVGKLTIGYGRNLDDVGITKSEARYMLMGDIAVATEAAKRLFYNFDLLTENRKAVVVNMAFNLGENRLATFSRMRKFVQESKWDAAAVEMINSKWANQVGNRAHELADLMERG